MGSLKQASTENNVLKYEFIKKKEKKEFINLYCSVLSVPSNLNTYFV